MPAALPLMFAGTPDITDIEALLGAVDGILQAQARADADYFLGANGRSLSAEEAAQVHATVLRAYRWQYIVSGVQGERFQAVLGGLIDAAQLQRIASALGPIIEDVNRVVH